MKDINIVATNDLRAKTQHTVTIEYDVEFPDEIDFSIFPEPSSHVDNTCTFTVTSNQALDINVVITRRDGYRSNVQLKKIMYDDVEMIDKNAYCTLYRDGKAHKTHGWIDGGRCCIRIRSNPISQHFLEYFLSLTSKEQTFVDQ